MKAKMNKNYYGKKWTLSFYDKETGSKRFGPEFWFNDQRTGFDLYFWTWNLTILREHR